MKLSIFTNAEGDKIILHGNEKNFQGVELFDSAGNCIWEQWNADADYGQKGE